MGHEVPAQSQSDGPSIEDIDDTYERVARALADVELPEKRRGMVRAVRLGAAAGAIPAGRIMSNAGAQDHKPATSTINCTVSGTIVDSMDDILSKVHEAGLTLKAGCGIGYEFSTLRPRGAYVSGAGAYTSGPLSFMDIYDKMCFTVSSAGGRRGAQMGTFDIGHPDVMDFIRAKREDGRLRQFNLSLLITDDFMQAVKEDRDWKLAFPVPRAKEPKRRIDLDDASKSSGANGRLRKRLRGQRCRARRCRIYKHAAGAARVGRDHVVHLRLRRAGLRADRSRQRDEQQLVVREHSRHQPVRRAAAAALRLVPARLHEPHRFVAGRSPRRAYFDWDEFREVVKVVHPHARQRGRDQRSAAWPKQRDEITRKRRHGMGFLGLGSAITMLGMRYGSEESIAFTDEVSREMAIAGWETGVDLAREKGPAPIMLEEFEVTRENAAKRPEMARDGWKVGDRVPGRILHARYSRYMQRSPKSRPTWWSRWSRRRALHASQLDRADRHHLAVAREQRVQRHRTVVCASLLPQRDPRGQEVQGEDRRLLVRAAGLPRAGQPARDAGLDECRGEAAGLLRDRGQHRPSEHVDIQAASQKWVDSSISKTANVPTDFRYEEFKDIYMYAHEKGLKGCTTFRFNPEAFQGVLVKEEDLKNTTYVFSWTTAPRSR